MRVLLICNYKPGVGGISGQVEILQRKLREEGHTADLFSTKGSFHWRLGLFYHLWKVAKEYDVLHIHCCSEWGFLPVVVGVTVGRGLKKRVVLTYHGGGGEKFFDKHPKLVHHYLTRTNANIVLSGFLASVFDKHDLPHTIIPNIIELDERQYRERTAIRPHFICTRAHEALYNIPCILRAFQKIQIAQSKLKKHSKISNTSQSELKELSELMSLTGSSVSRAQCHARMDNAEMEERGRSQISEVTLTLVGDGSEHEALMQMVNDMGLKNVIFTGRVDNSEIYRYLDQADVFLSAPTVDNMPVSVLEAMNAGLLVISSRVGGVPYMIKNGNNGLLFDSDDSDKLAELMMWAIENQNLSKAMIQKSKKDVNHYRWESIKEQLYTAYGILS